MTTAESDDNDLLPVDEVVDILERSHAHRDAIRYVRRADDRGGTSMLNSWRYQLNYVAVEKLADRGTQIEGALIRDGAAGALRCGNLDVRNTDICESIMDDYHR